MMRVIKKYLFSKPLFVKSSAVLALALLFLGTFSPVHSAEAFFHGIVGETLDLILGVLFLITPFGIFTIGVKLALIFTGILGMIPVLISAFILNVVLGDALIIAPYTHGGIVDVGWLITRDIANLFFIAIILIIAVATMLGQQDRGVRLLPKLIMVALLVNFTKVIAGMTVDIANIITNYFLTPVKSYGNIAVNLFFHESALGRLVETAIALIKDLGLNPASWLNILTFLQVNFGVSALLGDIVSTIMMIIIAVLLSFTLLVFAAIFFVRYIAIWVLVIFSPLAFAAMILPDTAQFARKWWSEFIKWSFIGVGPALILYISAKIIELKNEILTAGGGGYSASQALVAQEGGFFQNLLSPVYILIADILFWLVLLTFIWIGLAATLGMNKKVSGLIVKGGRAVLKAAGNWAKGQASQRWGGKAQDWLEKRAAAGAGKWGNRIGLGGALRAGTKFASQKVRDLARSKEAQAEAAKMTDGMLDAQLQTETDALQLKAMIEEKIKRGDAKDVEDLIAKKDTKFSKEKMEATITNLALRNLESDIINAFPQYAHASRNVKGEDKFDDDIRAFYEERDEAGNRKHTLEEAKNAQYVKSRSKERAKLIQDSALGDRGVLAGLEANPNVDIFEDLATTSQRLDRAVEGYRHRYGEQANKKLAEAMKRKNIKNAAALLKDEKNEEFRKELAAIPNKVTFDWLREIADQHGGETAEKFVRHFRKMAEENPDQLIKNNPGIIHASFKHPARATIFGTAPLMEEDEFKNRSKAIQAKAASTAERERRRGRATPEEEMAAARRRRAGGAPPRGPIPTGPARVAMEEAPLEVEEMQREAGLRIRPDRGEEGPDGGGGGGPIPTEPTPRGPTPGPTPGVGSRVTQVFNTLSKSTQRIWDQASPMFPFHDARRKAALFGRINPTPDMTPQQQEVAEMRNATLDQLEQLRGRANVELRGFPGAQKQVREYAASAKRDVAISFYPRANWSQDEVAERKNFKERLFERGWVPMMEKILNEGRDELQQNEAWRNKSGPSLRQRFRQRLGIGR